MYTSFSTALSALSAHSVAVDVVGNNLANLNTPGFKASSVSFYDLVAHSIDAGQGESQVGVGVARPSTIRQFTQGSIQSTSGPLDAAIQGPGFLVMKSKSGATVYGRGGNLQVDRDGVLMSPTGEKVQGWMLGKGALDITQPIGEISVPVGSLRPASATTKIGFNLNLDARATAGPPADTFTSTAEVYDSLGISHLASVRLTKTANPGEWSYSLSIPDSDLTAPLTPATGTIQFDENGTLVSPSPTHSAPVISTTDLKSGAAPLNITWDLYSGATPNLTQFAQPSATSLIWQDGFAAAQLVSVGLGDGGVLLAEYSDGKQVAVGQLAMAAIRNPDSLIAVGNNTFRVSFRSATPVVGLPGTGGRGTVLGGSVENSTVDIAQEFTKLIVLQRGYQANTRIVTTVDEMSQETINLKR